MLNVCYMTFSGIYMFIRSNDVPFTDISYNVSVESN